MFAFLRLFFFNLFSLGRMSITGHSMGGHGALVAHLKNPGQYVSVSGKYIEFLVGEIIQFMFRT